MSQFLELIINGVSLGFVYALIALGFTIVFRANRVVNFAHTKVLLLGAYVIALLHDRIGFAGALIVGIASASIASALIEILLVRRLRYADHTTLAILTIAVNVLLTTELTREIGSSILTLGDPFGSGVVHFGGLTLPATRIAAAATGLVIVAVLAYVMRRSSWGLAMRCSAENPETAALMGIRLNRVAVAAWALAGAVAAIGGLFLTTFPTPGVTPNVALVALGAFPAAIIGGLDSLPGAVVGGITIGIVTNLTAGYQDHLGAFGPGLADVTPFLVMVLALLARPAGLFGKAQVSRV
ncbi:MAG: branched-chain amino acid ABC transporter permease [Candidatus Dormibacteraeota bacterium]|nr:branched-chain amino acid ABC transporter permease [Candidatus Dormibacteraeota bacterium]